MRIGKLNVTIGSDPELFVKHNGKFVSGHELIPGTKEDPFPVPRGAVQVDGTALEFNTDPASNLRQFHNASNSVIKALKSMIPDDHELVAAPVADYGKKYLDTLPFKAVELGCSPDWNAYTMMENPTPDADTPFRTASGHIHIGWTNVKNPYDEKHMLECCSLVKALDVFLGVPSLLIDTDNRRRNLYGKAGAFRPKEYGLEYRVLSNFWVLDAKLRAWVWQNTKLAIQRLQDRDSPLSRYWGVDGAIDNNSSYDRDKVLRFYNVPVPEGYSVPKASSIWD